jgi:hypothetical protein
LKEACTGAIPSTTVFLTFFFLLVGFAIVYSLFTLAISACY